MDTKNPSAPSRAPSAVGRKAPHSRANPRPSVRRPDSPTAGVVHENTRHTSRFTVIGNHLAQHTELTLLAIGLACHLQSLPAGAQVDIKSLAVRFPEGPTRIAAGLRELESHGYLRRERHRTAAGRIVTRTVSCNQPGSRAPGAPPPNRSARSALSARPHETAALRAPGPGPGPGPGPVPAPRTGATAPRAGTNPSPCSAGPSNSRSSPASSPVPPAPPRGRRPLPPVPQPELPGPTHLRQATEVLAGLHRLGPAFLLSDCEVAHLTPGVVAWLQRDIAPDTVRSALTDGLPPEGVHRAAAFLAHRLTARLPPVPPPRDPATATRDPHRNAVLLNCEGCDRAFRSSEPDLLCRTCRASRNTGA